MKITKTIAFSLLVGGASMAQADVLINTFGQNGLGYVPSVGWNLNSGQWLGKTFTLVDSYNLTDIDVALRLDGDSDQVLVSLRTDSGGQPGSVLESFTLTNQFGGGVAGVYNMDSVLNPLMVAGTYYVTLETIGDATGKWNLNNGGGQGLMVVSTDLGGSWTSFTDTNGAITVQGTLAVPEPASMAALGLGVVALIRRRRNRSG